MDESDEPIYTYNDKSMRYLLQQSIKVGRCASLNQYYKSNISDELFDVLSKKINVIGNIYEELDNYPNLEMN